MVLVWLDAMTSKQGTLLSVIARELKSLGYDVLITCRSYEYTVGSIKRFGFDPIVIGTYSEGDSREKVMQDIKRMEGLLNLLTSLKKMPEILVAYPNPPAARVAFGLGIRYIALTDSPHAVIPSRMSLPLADAIITPIAVPRSEIEKYIYRNETSVHQYEGVDELAWILRYKPDRQYITSVLNLKPFNYIVFRPHEYLATYYGINPPISVIKVIKELGELGYTIVLLPRYSTDEFLIKELNNQGVSVRLIKGMYDGVSLVYFARAVITGGATLAREAALLGTLGITYFPFMLYVNDYVASKGFPLYVAKSNSDIIKLVISRGTSYKEDYSVYISRLKSTFEDPVEVILRVITKLIS